MSVLWRIIIQHATLMPSSHLACDGSTEPVSCPYPPFRAASARPPCEAGGGCMWDFRTDARAPRPLRFGVAWSLKNLKKKKNRKPVARRHVVGGIAQSQHGHRAKADPCTGSVRFPCGGCGDCTATALTLHDFRTISAQSLYGFTPGCPRGPVA